MSVRDAIKIVLEYGAVGVDVLERAIRVYLSFLQRVLLPCGVIFISCLGVLLAAPAVPLFQSRFVYSAAVVVATVCVIVFVALLAPLLAAVERIVVFDELRRWAPRLAIIGQTGALMLAGIWFLPTHAAPRLIPLIVVGALVLGFWGPRDVGSTLRRVVLTKIAIAIGVVSVGAYLSIAAPLTSARIRDFAINLDGQIAGFLTNSEQLTIGPSADIPLLDSKNRPWPLVREADGKPQVWYAERNGELVFYSAFQALPDGTLLKPIETGEELQRVADYLREIRALREREEQRRQETFRIEEQRRRDSLLRVEREQIRRDAARQRYIQHSGAVLFRSSGYFEEVIRDLRSGERVAVLDSQLVSFRAGQAVMRVSDTIVGAEGRLTVSQGAPIVLLGEAGQALVVAARQGRQEFVGTVPHGSVDTTPQQPEYWYRIRTERNEVGFVPRRHTSGSRGL